MKEWDTASYIRKFHSTFTVVKHKATGNLATVYCGEFTVDKFMCYLPETGEANWVPMKDVDFQYIHFPSGWWTPQTLLVRRNEMVFSVGINISSHRLYLDNPETGFKLDNGMWGSSKWRALKLHEGLKPITMAQKETSLEYVGPISTKLYLSKKGLYYLTQRIGEREGRKIRAMPPFKQEVRDALRGCVWQEI